MEIENLFQGPGLVIDDKVFDDSGDCIVRIVSYLESLGYPLAKYDSVLDLKGENCMSFSFILLDWELVSVTDEAGLPIQGAEVAAQSAKDGLVKLLKEVLEKCYLPIFIFSNSAPKDIERELRKNGVDIKSGQLPILIEHKANLVSDQGVLLMGKIRDWVDKMPSIYVLKEWENALGQAKTHTFKSLANTHSWPVIMWNAAHDDHVPESEEMMELLTQNVFGRMHPVSIEKDQLDKDDALDSNIESLLDVLSVQRFDGRVNKETSTTGDFYKIGSKYYVNIRPACDCVARGKDTNVYLVEAQQMTKSVKDLFLSEYGNFTEKNNEAILGPLYKKKFYRILFHSTTIWAYDRVKDGKVGRILPPFIRHITERYGLYIQRQALPRIPLEVFYTKEEIVKIREKKGQSQPSDEPG
ncbi:MAG: hypothetical protein IKH89_08305 [Bacteroidales bacterium]|nr:hypothetical protein [Bacteroidales bacterium]